MEEIVLSASEHAAKRETDAMYQSCFNFGGPNTALQSVIEATADRFAVGRRLDEKTFASMTRNLSEAVAASEPILTTEKKKPGTRIRPENATWELQVLSRSAHPHNTQLFFMESLRVAATRKKLVIDTYSVPLVIKRHLMERAIKRDMAAWRNGLTGVESTILDRIGLCVVWNHAFATGLVDTPHMVLPIGDGIILGSILDVPLTYHRKSRLALGRDGTTRAQLPPDPFTAYQGSEKPQSQFIFSTILNGDILRPPQCSIRDDLQSFVDRYSRAMDELSKCVFWQQSTIDPPPQYEDVVPALDLMARELAQITHDPANAGCLDGPINREHEEHGIPAPSMA